MLVRFQAQTVLHAVRLAEQAHVAAQREVVFGAGEMAQAADVQRSLSRPVLDDRSPDEILSYDENGLPT